MIFIIRAGFPRSWSAIILKTARSASERFSMQASTDKDNKIVDYLEYVCYFVNHSCGDEQRPQAG